MKYYSQYGQDEFIHQNLLSDTDSKIFVDVGAYDGIQGSNTMFFEESLNWDGLCFEPIPVVFNQLILNRKCQCINGAAWNKNEQQTFRAVEGYPEMLSGIVDEFNPEHINRINREGGKYTDIIVDCYDLNELLIQNNITNITYMSVDTEGSEFTIIKNLDLSVINVKIFSVENNYSDSNVYDYLVGSGYQRLTSLGIDDLYIKI